jgi:hypothetical protein
VHDAHDRFGDRVQAAKADAAAHVQLPIHYHVRLGMQRVIKGDAYPGQHGITVCAYQIAVEECPHLGYFVEVVVQIAVVDVHAIAKRDVSLKHVLRFKKSAIANATHHQQLPIYDDVRQRTHRLRQHGTYALV